MSSPAQDRRVRVAGALVGLLALLLLFVPVIPVGPRQEAPPPHGGEVSRDQPRVPSGRAVEPPAPQAEAHAALRGTITLPDGTAASGARVRVAGSALLGFLEVTTDADGRFRLAALPSGFYEVQAFRGRYVSEVKRGVQMRPGEAVELDLEMALGVSVHGRVVSARTGEGIRGAEVRVSGELLDIAPRIVETADDGSFVVPGLTPGAKVVRVHKEGFVQDGPLQMTPEEGEVLIRLGTEARLTLEVVDPRGRPVVDAEAQLLVLGELHGGDAPLPRDRLLVVPGPVPPIPIAGAAPDARESILASASSNEDGDVELRGLRATRVRVRLSAVGRPTILGEPIELRPGRTSHAEMTLPHGGTLSVRVFDAHGARAEDVALTVKLEGDPIGAYARTDENGEAELTGLLGDLSVRASRGTAPPTVQRISVGEGEHRTLTLTLGDAQDELSGRVVDGRGFGIAGAGLELRTLSRRSPFTAAVRAEGDGTFRFEELPPPPYHVVARHPAYAESEPVRVESLRDALTITLDPGGAVLGDLLDRRSLEPVSAEITLRRGPSERREITARAGSTGRFEIENVPLGRWTLRVDHPRYLRVEQPIELVRSGPRPPRVDLGRLELTPGAAVSGELVDSIGEPIYGALIVVGEGAHDEVRTDEGGRFSASRLPPGRTRVRATLDSGEVVESAPFALREGETREDVRLRARSRGEAADVPESPGERVGVPLTVTNRDGAVVVEWVAPGSRAQRAGIREGDRLLAIDGQPMTIAAQARPLLRDARRSLRLSRGGRTLDVVVGPERFTPP